MKTYIQESSKIWASKEGALVISACAQIATKAQLFSRLFKKVSAFICHAQAASEPPGLYACRLT